VSRAERPDPLPLTVRGTGKGPDPAGDADGLSGVREAEPTGDGDLIGLAVHAGLGEHGAGLLVSHREQVNGQAVAAGVAGASVPSCRPRPAPAAAGGAPTWTLAAVRL
jgi:hypothetical protein